jgi:alpha-N-arabinofuranosidase
VLERIYDEVDYVSLHTYFGKGEDDLRTFLARSLEMDEFIETVIATCDHVRAKKRSKKTMNLAFGEWNVWYHSLEGDQSLEPWAETPAQLNDVYTLEDALVVGCMIISLLKHADRVRIACLAQLVNVIAPVMTRTGGPAWRQTIFWPFLYVSRFGRGTVLRPAIQTPRYDTPEIEGVPFLEACAVADEGAHRLTLFAVNRDPDGPMLLSGVLRLPGGYAVEEHLVLEATDPGAKNTTEHPDAVVPHSRGDAAVRDATLTATLPRL